MQKVDNSLLMTHRVTAHHGHVFFGQDNGCANEHAQLCELYCAIQSVMWNSYHFPDNLFCSFHLCSSALTNGTFSVATETSTLVISSS